MSPENGNIVSESEAINIEFLNICYSVCTRKRDVKTEILKGLSGKFEAGRMCAIMGPSGAGKSSLMNIISGFKTTFDEGEILINGQICSVNEFRRKSCYILQEFALHSKLTANETLKFAAELKLPAKVSEKEKLKIVHHVLNILGLDRNANTHVDKLSGGECKRLSIGVELLTNPPVMFLDEPTSGLDSVSAVQVVSHLRDLARAGRTIVCVIHQPSSRLLEFFDDLYVISNGQCIYSGSVEKMVGSFQESGFECPLYYNRADFALEIAAGERPGNLNALIQKSIRKAPSDVQDGNCQDNRELSERSQMLQKTPILSSNPNNHDGKNAISQWRQFSILLKRSFICIARESIITQLKIATHLFVGLLIGGIFYNIGNDGAKVSANISLLFFIIMFIFFGNSIQYVLLYPVESRIFYREYLNNWYGFFPYFYSKIVAELPCLMISTFATLLPVYYITNQPMELERFLLFANIYVLTTIISLFSGLAVGAQFSTQVAVFMMPAFGMPLIVFCGYFIHYSELPSLLQPLTFIPFFRYIFEGSFQAIYGFGRKSLDCHQVFCYFRSVPKILEMMDMKENTYTLDLLGILVWIVLFKILLYIVLRMKIRKFTV
ncbi:ATP-binding cassette sub-family G member 1-like [Phlebotomus argentipes]|uniref:ATP-binding cassette sub-family G member 1-like n=1 Tax=Phlebotomus argentipes TaxID=94469 RepID=UPI0028936635|nr:ATP-binding cassette sub-family G member 1-like [Phlebotomus argentipes]